MTTSEKKSVRRDGSELLIVDNSDSEWKVLQYLKEWASISHQFDIASAYFEIGSLLSLEGDWQKVDHIRILMGDEVTKRTKKALVEAIRGIANTLDASIEREKEKNDFLNGVPAIVEALRTKKIVCRVYAKRKFHAKAYITHSRLAVVGSSALVGSSNFTYPGLTENIELNVQLRREVAELQEWYERHWNEADDVTEELLKTMERHTREYLPFDVYAKSLQELFGRRSLTDTDWEETKSVVYPLLDQYQKDGYHNLLKIAEAHRGAFLCDGVGLGKTFIGMMLIDRLVNYDRKKVALFVPKSARESVWEAKLDRYLPGLTTGVFKTFSIFNHTDLSSASMENKIAEVSKEADVIIIDEAHNFRNPGIMGKGRKAPSRYWKMNDIAQGKQLFLLTATPVNNHLIDLQHMIELFTRRQADYFKNTIGIHSLPGHFRKMEKALETLLDRSDPDGVPTEVSMKEAENILRDDVLFQSLVVQRSRAFVHKSQQLEFSDKAIFPKRENPIVVEYSLAKTYGPLLQKIEKAFAKEKPLFTLSLYYPLSKLRDESIEVDTWTEGRQKQVVGLIRTLFLKRFESSVQAFEESCQMLLRKLLAFVTKHSETSHEKRMLDRWLRTNEEILRYTEQQMHERMDDEGEEDLISDVLLEDVEYLPRDEYRVDEIIDETREDMNQLVEFIKDLMHFSPAEDDKLQRLIALLQRDQRLKQHKALIFTEYMATARYLQKELVKAGFEGIDEVDSTSKRKRDQVIRQFAPYYNDSSSSELREKKLSETRILISTDVLSEGLNLQDATFLMNYDIHWNPVRLMQRIGRVDRRYDPQVEQRILKDHPEQSGIRGVIVYWNFLPPDELNQLLTLYARVTHKTLRISKTFGIEGKKLLSPDEDFDALKIFNADFEGTESTKERLALEYQALMEEFPDLEKRIAAFPGRVFSGREKLSEHARAVFFCFALPALEKKQQEESEMPEVWSEEAGHCQWFLFKLESKSIVENLESIADYIRSRPDTPRRTSMQQEELSEIRKVVERHITKTYLRSVQAPIGVKPILKAWMEIT